MNALPSSFTQALKDKALSLGFFASRVVSVSSPFYGAEFVRWLESGFHGDMAYMEKSRAVRLNPQLLLPTPKSAVVLAMRYPMMGNGALMRPRPLPEKWRTDPRFGHVARYAWGGRDYHKIIQPRLIALDALVREYSGRAERAKTWVDIGPVLERDVAETAGIGFIGKNTCAINARFGSWFFLASLWLPEKLIEDETAQRIFNPDFPLEPTRPFVSGVFDEVAEKNKKKLNYPQTLDNRASPFHQKTPNGKSGFKSSNNANAERGVNKTLIWPRWDDPHPPTSRVGACGACVRCINACPTQALSPYQLDATRCISYWTIEAKGEPPPELAKNFGRWIFGCDDCQTTCPWNDEINPEPSESEAWQEWAYPNGPLILLAEGFDGAHPYWLDDAAFLKKFAGTPLMRAGREKMLSNVRRVMADPL